jgi:hypothetical protein
MLTRYGKNIIHQSDSVYRYGDTANYHGDSINHQCKIVIRYGEVYSRRVEK